MSFYVYQYIDDFGNPYYIGKGSGRRMHVEHTHTKLPDINKRIIIRAGLTNEQAKELEKQLIQKYGRKIDGGILDNIKINQWACAVGWKHSVESKRKISQGNKGKRCTAEHKKNYQHAKSQNHAENIKQAVKQLWANPEYREQRKMKVMETRRRNGHSQ
jgi:hypothetical protein